MYSRRWSARLRSRALVLECVLTLRDSMVQGFKMLQRWDVFAGFSEGRMYPAELHALIQLRL